MNKKINSLTVLISLCLLTSCAYFTEPAACPQRAPFIGKTYRDALGYCGQLEQVYDGCSAKK